MEPGAAVLYVVLQAAQEIPGRDVAAVSGRLRPGPGVDRRHPHGHPFYPPHDDCRIPGAGGHSVRGSRMCGCCDTSAHEKSAAFLEDRGVGKKACIRIGSNKFENKSESEGKNPAESCRRTCRVLFLFVFYGKLHPDLRNTEGAEKLS